MVLTMLQLVLFIIPFCLGRIMDSPPAQELGKGKIYFPNKDASKRTLKPSLNIRNGPIEFLDVMAGDNKFLECEAGGTPPPTIHWLKNGQKVPQNLYEASRPRIDNEVDTTLGLGFTRSRLFIDCATEKDSGRYTCVAENEYIRTFRSSQVFVSESIEPGNEAMCLTKKNYGTPARVHMWTHTRLELMGSDVQLYCRSNGDPQAQVVWRGPSNNVLNNSRKYDILPNGDLIVRNIVWADMGGYSCQAKNTEGSDEALIFLYPTMPDSEDDM